jgi:hypothetical protein
MNVKSMFLKWVVTTLLVDMSYAAPALPPELKVDLEAIPLGAPKSASCRCSSSSGTLRR